VEFWSDGMRIDPSYVKPADSYCAKNVTNVGFTVDNGGSSPFAKCTYNKTWVNYKVTLVSPEEVAGKVVTVHFDQTSPVGADYVFAPTRCSDASSDKIQCLPGKLPNYVFSADIIVWPNAGGGGSAGFTER
ncbi:Mycobacterium numidiamassiliense ORFan, partial [Mycobacterium numidiamassiliense]